MTEMIFSFDPRFQKKKKYFDFYNRNCFFEKDTKAKKEDQGTKLFPTKKVPRKDFNKLSRKAKSLT